MKSLLTTFVLLFTFIFAAESQCYLEKVACGTLKAALENVPVHILNIKTGDHKAVRAKSGRATLLTFTLEEETAPGIWRKLRQFKTDKPEVTFAGVGNGIYRVTSIANNAIYRAKTKIHKHTKQNFSPRLDGFTSNKVSMQDCKQTLNLNTAYPAGHISIYPNPTNDRVYIKGISSGTGSVSAALHDLSGRQVLLQDFNAAAFELDLSGINEGIYFLELKGGDGSLHLIKKIAIVR